MYLYMYGICFTCLRARASILQNPGRLDFLGQTHTILSGRVVDDWDYLGETVKSGHIQSEMMNIYYI